MQYNKIAFYRTGPIGDCMVALKGIYMTKTLFPSSHLVVYTNFIGFQLFRQFSFIDTLINVDEIENLKAHINEQCFDVCILTQASKRFCEIFDDINCKTIYTFLTARTLIRRHFKTIFFSRNFCKISQYERILRLVRMLDKKRYDEIYPHIDFSPTTLHPSSENEAFIVDFFKQNHIDLAKSLILINPFVNSTACNLTIDGYLAITKHITNHYDVNVVINYSSYTDIKMIGKGGAILRSDLASLEHTFLSIIVIY